MRKQLFTLYFNIFLIFLGIGLVIPVLPVYLKDLGLKGSDLGVLVLHLHCHKWLFLHLEVLLG